SRDRDRCARRHALRPGQRRRWCLRCAEVHPGHVRHRGQDAAGRAPGRPRDVYRHRPGNGPGQRRPGRALPGPARRPAPFALEEPRMSPTSRYAETLEEIRDAGLFKAERIITSPQAAEITLEDGRTVLNFCANNYLGLADHPAMIQAAKEALDTHGF